MTLFNNVSSVQTSNSQSHIAALRLSRQAQDDKFPTLTAEPQIRTTRPTATPSSIRTNCFLELQLPNDYCYSATLLYTARCRAHTLNLDSQLTQRIQSSFQYSFPIG